MPSQHLDDYLYRRAEVELRMAENAAGPAAVKAHYELAQLYLDRIRDESAGREWVRAENYIGRAVGGR
jgi:hypothetical protein